MGFHETIAPDETARFEGFAAEIKAIQARRTQKHGVAARALHVKQHLGVTGTITGTGGPGVFAAGSSWPVYVRFSNGSTNSQRDGEPDVRGIALKLVGVPGKKIIPGLEDKKTQDFLLIPSEAFAMRTPD